MSLRTKDECTVHVDQVVFTSVRSNTGEGYRIIAASSGVRTDEKSDITRRAPSHGSLCASNDEPVGFMCFQTASGRYCVGYSCHAGKEHTARGGHRVYSHFVLLSDSEYAVFDWHPVRLMESLRNAIGDEPVLKQQTSFPKLTLTTSDHNFDPRASESVAPNTVARTLNVAGRALAGQAFLALTQEDGLVALKTMLTVIPASSRRKLAASAGLKFSPTRQLQICFVAPDSGETARSMRGFDLRKVDYDEETGTPTEASSFKTWLDFAGRRLSAGRCGEIASLTAAMNGDAPADRLARVAMLCVDLDLVETLDMAAIGRITDRWLVNHRTTIEPESTLLRQLAIAVEARTEQLNEMKDATEPAVTNR